MQDGPGLCLAVGSVAAFSSGKKGHSFPINKPCHLVNIAQHTWCAGRNTGTNASASACVLLKNLSHGARKIESLLRAVGCHSPLCKC